MFALNVILPLLCLTLVRSIDLDGTSTTASDIHSHDTDIFFFTRKVIKALLKTRDWDGGIIMSPFAMEFALGLVALGATGDTLKELTDVAGTNLLELGDHKHGYAKKLVEDMQEMTSGQINVGLQTAAILAINSDYMPHREFVNEARKWYHAVVQPLKFEYQYLAANNISEYVAAQTAGRIEDLVQKRDIDEEDPMLVASYLDVSVKWMTRFDEKQTLLGQFYTQDGTLQPKEMIVGQFFANITHNDDLEAKILSLPLQGGNLTMTFVLPDRKNGLNRLLPKIIKDVDALWDAGQYIDELIPTYVALPKMRIETNLYGKRILNKMGVNRVFEDNAELENIAFGGNLHLTQIIQKSVIEIDEWGVNAASSPQVKFEDHYELGQRRQMVEEYFVADHPFLFTMTIRPRDDVLFFGVYGGA